MSAHRERRVRGLAMVVAFLAALSASSCQQRLASLDEEDQGLKWCVIVNAARVYDDEGNSAGMIFGQEGYETQLCWCLTREQGLAYDREMVNDLAYATCLENAAAMGYPENHDCAYWHSIGHWGEVMFRVHLVHEHIICELDDGEEAGGCSVR